MSSKVSGGRLKQHLQEKNSVDIDNTARSRNETI